MPMSESIQIIILTGSLITGILAIMLGNQLTRKYNLPYLTSYFYYLIFLFVFGIYGIIGSRLIRIFLLDRDMDPEAVESIYLFITYLGIPFLVLSWYMFIRMSHEMVNRKVGPVFNLVFFAVTSVGFLGFGFLLGKRDLVVENPLNLIRISMLAGFSVLSGLVYAWSLVRIFVHSGEFLDRKDRTNIRLYGGMYGVFALGTILLINLAGMGRVFSLAFVILLFASHLIPIFFLSMYLDKNFVEPVVRQEFDQSLANFVRRFEISRRESEIVELICKGKSNQDISDSLFISLQTVKDHIHRIYLKTGVKNRVQLTNLIRRSS
jgi:DNA-binding CsgD family transcriptional regulator